MTSVVLYARDGCHLCDEARRVIEDTGRSAPFAFTEIDIETDDTLIREYGIRIPVVEIDGEERFEYEVDATELASIVRGA